MKKETIKICLLLILIVVFCVTFCACQNKDDGTQSTVKYSKAENYDAEAEKSPKEIYKEACEYVVMVIVYDSTDGQIISCASGVVLSEDGYIITNSHVVGDTYANDVKVQFSDERILSAKVVGFDVQSDLAVIKVGAKNLKTATLADSDKVSVGDWVFALGNPGTDMEIFENTLTRGIISGTNRSIGSNTAMKYFQTDAAINAGNSGGALINTYGQVVGINSVKIDDNSTQNISFAAQINQVEQIVNDIIQNGEVTTRVKLGILATEINENQMHLYDTVRGVVVVSIGSDSSLAGTQMQPSDIITQVNKKDIKTMDELNTELNKHKIGDTVELTLYRMSDNSSNAKTFTVKATLMEDKNPNNTMST